MDSENPNARYHRQMLLPGFGERGQAALSAAHIAVVGLGALGCVIADQLCRAGIGTLTLIDRDIVELSNLQRQTLYITSDVGRSKAEAAQDRLSHVNPAVRLFCEPTDLRSDSAESILGILSQRPAAIIDGTDNFHTRYLLNDVCCKHGLPLIYGGAVGTTGTAMLIRPRAPRPQIAHRADDHPPCASVRACPCLRCIAPLPPETGSVPTCDTAGVLAAATGIIGSVQSALALREVVGLNQINAGPAADQAGQLLEFDLADFGQHAWRVRDLSALADPDCICCGQGTYDFLAGRFDTSERVLCGRNTVQILPARASTPSLRSPAAWLDEVASRGLAMGAVTRSGRIVRIALPPSPASTAAVAMEISVFEDRRVLITGTTDIARARALAAQLLG